MVADTKGLFGWLAEMILALAEVARNTKNVVWPNRARGEHENHMLNLPRSQDHRPPGACLPRAVPDMQPESLRDSNFQAQAQNGEEAENSRKIII